MNFNFSIYPFRNRFPEVEKDELERKDAYPVNSENEDLIVLDEEHREYIVDFGKETVGYLKFFAQGEGVLHIVYGEWRKELFDTGGNKRRWNKPEGFPSEFHRRY